MDEVAVLAEGYARKTKNGWIANSTSVLVKSRGKIIIVDPGCRRQMLLDALKRENVKTGDVDFVLITHSHADHSMLMGIFGNAKVLDCDEIFDGDMQVSHGGAIPGTSLKIIQTPGHSEDHCSLLAKTEKGICAIAGDVFWWQEGEKQEINANRKDAAHPSDVKKLARSRKLLLERADWIIPGHGKPFRTKRRQQA
jgi:glyoxylase-like metal-dependent hydrolase (beta-lactamase superfamily II)